MNLQELKTIIEDNQIRTFNGLPVLVNNWKECLPSLTKGFSIVITGGVGSGKTTFTLDKFVLDQIQFVNSNSEIDCFYSYFSLEETKHRMDLKILGRFLYEKTKLQFGIQDFSNLDGSKKVFPYISQLDTTQSLINSFNQKVEIIEDCKTPKQIKSKIDETVKKLGSRLSDPNFYYIVIIDNLKFVRGEGSQKKKDVIDEIAIEILQDYRIKHGIIPIIIQHQSREGENPKYDFKNNLLIESVIPSLDCLGESTYTQDPATHVIGIFDPNRYSVKEFPITNGYDITVFKDKIRFLRTLKSRDGLASDTAFYFNGKVSLFEELPDPNYFKTNGYSKYGLTPTNKTKSKWETQLDLD